MAEAGKPRKAADIAWSEDTETPEGDRKVWCEFVYCGMAYSFDTTYSQLSATQWSEWSIENLFRSIGDDFDKYQHSRTLQDLLKEQAVTLRVSPVESWYEVNGLWVFRQLPKGRRRRKKELVSYFLADVLQNYIDKHDETPSKDELWNWLFTLWWERPSHFLKKWEISGDPKNGGDPATGYTLYLDTCSG